MSTHSHTERVTITLDGRQVEARWREPILAVTRRYGLYIPTLCHHEALEPAGACRLCLVEVIQRRRRKVVTACNFPVEDGIEVLTNSELVQRSRRLTIESLLARCPEVPAIQKLARKLGVERSRFVPNDDTCILCGLCTRVCDTYVTSAIAMLERGVERRVGTFADAPPEDCVGCGACAEICPTDHIQVEREGETFRIWERSFPLAIAGVDAELCRACGACEEACPFAIPRVALKRGGEAAAWIDPETCKACGVCVAACPTGAITQPRELRALPVRSRALVVACGRANLGNATSPRLPDGAQVLELSCSGGASAAMLLGALARGFDGVLVLGRNESTCRLNGAEQHARETAARVEQLAQMAGLGAGRVRFADPPPGRMGPVTAIQGFLDQLEPSPLAEPMSPELVVDTPDGAMAILRWLSGREELLPAPEAWLASQGLPAAEPGQPALLAGPAPYLDILLEEWLRPDSLAAALREALELLREFGIEAGVAVGGFQAGAPRLVERLAGSALYGLGGECDRQVAAAGGAVTAIQDLIAAQVESLPSAGTPLVAGEIGSRLAIDASQRRALEQRLADAGAAGASALVVADPVELVQYLIARRTGSWRHTHVEPMLATSLIARQLQPGEMEV